MKPNQIAIFEAILLDLLTAIQRHAADPPSRARRRATPPETSEEQVEAAWERTREISDSLAELLIEYEDDPVRRALGDGLVDLGAAAAEAMTIDDLREIAGRVARRCSTPEWAYAILAAEWDGIEDFNGDLWES